MLQPGAASKTPNFAEQEEALTAKIQGLQKQLAELAKKKQDIFNRGRKLKLDVSFFLVWLSFYSPTIAFRK